MNYEPSSQEFKYLGIRIKRIHYFGDALRNLCLQSKRAHNVLNVHILIHPTLSVEHILRLLLCTNQANINFLL